jgi:hypothetical protein
LGEKDENRLSFRARVVRVIAEVDRFYYGVEILGD